LAPTWARHQHCSWQYETSRRNRRAPGDDAGSSFPLSASRWTERIILIRLDQLARVPLKGQVAGSSLAEFRYRFRQYRRCTNTRALKV
jgi:hypothetical protein